MTIHLTKSGSIEHLDAWGHGRPARGNWGRRPATIITDDGDGHYQAWSVEGSMRDAAETLGGFMVNARNRGAVAVFDGAKAVELITEGRGGFEDFWIVTDDGVEPDLDNNPDMVAW